MLRKLASQIKGDTEITNDEIKKMLLEADSNKDGLIDQFEFKEAFSKAEDYAKLEEEYMKAFEEIAEYDKDKTSLSTADIDNAIKQDDALKKVDTASPEAASDSPGGGYNPTNGDDKTDPGDLTNKELPELKTERTEVLSDLNAKRNEKAQALSAAGIDVDTAKTAYNEKTAAFADIVKEKAENEKNTNEYAKKVTNFEDLKVAVNGEIAKQEGVVTKATELITTINNNLSSLTEPPKEISYFDEETGETVTKENPDYAAYLEKKAALEEELAAAEADLAAQEDTLGSLKEDLATAEESLENAINAYMQAEEEAGTLTEEERVLKTEIDTAKQTYYEKESAKKEIESSFDAEIKKLQESLITYNDAITEKELTLPEGYSSEKGKITNGENNLVKLRKEQLPDGYVVGNGTIKDAEGKIVGVTTGDEENQELYLYEEIEPASVSFAEKYGLVQILFEDSIDKTGNGEENIWSKLELNKYSSTDIAEMKELYNQFAEEYNKEHPEEQTGDFETQARTKLSGDEEDKKIYEKITESLRRAENKLEIDADNFETYLKNKNIDVINSSDEEMNKHLEEYMTEKYGESDYTKYYPGITAEQIEKYLGEEEIKALQEGGEEAVSKKIKEIINSEDLTPYEQINLLNTLKTKGENISSYVEKYFGKDDTYFYDKLNEMISAQNENGDYEYSSTDLMQFIKQYKNIDRTSGVLDNITAEKLETLLSVYEMTDDKKELSELNQYLSASALAKIVPQKFSDKEDVKEYVSTLFKASTADNLSEDGTLSIDPADYGITDEKIITELNQNYLNTSGTTAEKTEKILKDLTAGKIEKAEARYLVTKLLDGKPENIKEIAVGNSEIVSEIFDLYKGKAAKNKEVFSSDVEFETQYINPGDGKMPYLLIGPKNVDPDAELPVIVYMHGAGSMGKGEGALRNSGPGAILPDWDFENFNGYVICPTISGDVYTEGNWANERAENYLRDILKDFQTEHNVDSERMYIGGYSLGAMGAVYMAEHMDDVFSKAFVLSGYESNKYDINNVKIPIFGYVGSAETDSQRYMNGEFEKAESTDGVITVDGGHSTVPEKVFTRDADGNNRVDLFEWLFGDN